MRLLIETPEGIALQDEDGEVTVLRPGVNDFPGFSLRWEPEKQLVTQLGAPRRTAFLTMAGPEGT